MVDMSRILFEISPLTYNTIDINKRLGDCRKKLEGMCASRSDEKSQRAYLGKLATDFERIMGYSRNAHYKIIQSSLKGWN